MKDEVKLKGDIEGTIEWEDGHVEKISFHNAILTRGRQALAASLANEFGANYNFFISRMLFGNGGTTGGGETKYVNPERNGLFGTTVVNRPIISVIDPNNQSQVVLISVIPKDEGNGSTLNEMALQMNNGDLYSMATFPGISKTGQMQITWSWRLSFI